MRRRLRVTAVLLLIAASASAVQRDAPSRGDWSAQPKYDGKVTVVRLRWQSDIGGFGRRGGFGAAWNHDYPRAEQHLSQILKEVTFIDLHTDGALILALDDPDLFKYPIAYIIETGFWTMNEKEATGLRNYLHKGGFLIVDDFKPDGWRGIVGGGWQPFADNIQRVLPGARFFEMSQDDPIFHSFFEIKFLNGLR